MRVVVAMSGGVDSSVAAFLMKERGHDVVGVSLQLWDYSEMDENKFGSCCSPDDLYDARRVAERLGFPFYVVNSEPEFVTQVVDDFVSSYSEGRTPNPCVRCNASVKFPRLSKVVRGLGAERLVTGHYARKEARPGGEFRLLRAMDPAKDQTYYLCRLTREQLAITEFPLGGLVKDEVREIASRNGLPTASKHDSQELCFVPDNDYAGFISARSDVDRPGDIVDLDGEVVGRHRGLHRYTIGQRRGLGIAASRPLYVQRLDVAKNRVVVGPNSTLFESALFAREVNWIGNPPSGAVELGVKIRYRAAEVRSRVEPLPDGRYRIELSSPQRAITPGQAVVFYEGDEMLGGGWIDTGPDVSTVGERNSGDGR